MKPLLLLSLLIVLASCSSSTSPSKPADELPRILQGDSVHVSLGIPTDDNPVDDYIVLRHQYAISYNPNKGEPNWVSYELNASWYGDAERYDGNFITDNTLPELFTKIKHDDYTNSGYDRGHMVRSEERTRNDDDNKSTFYMTNIIPQTPDLNRGVWLDFEYYCEDLCKKENKELFVITGGIFHSDSTLKGFGKVSVPDSCYKIVVVLDSGKTIRDISNTTTVIAVVMPNIAGIRSDDWEKYRTTVRRIESSTKYNYLSFVKDDIQNVIENH